MSAARDMARTYLYLDRDEAFCWLPFPPAVQKSFYIGYLPGKLALPKLDGNQVDLPGRGACCKFKNRTCRVAEHYQSELVAVCDCGHEMSVMLASRGSGGSVALILVAYGHSPHDVLIAPQRFIYLRLCKAIGPSLILTAFPGVKSHISLTASIRSA